MKPFANPLTLAATWTAVGFAANQILRLLSNLLLTRLVQPDAFGLMAIVTVVVVGVEMITDLGINTSIVQNRRGAESEFVNTAFTLKVIRSCLMALVMGGIALPLSKFYSQPDLVQLLPAVALIVLISGFSSNSLSVASRQLWLGRATMVTIAGQVAATTVAVVFAYNWPNVWALIAGYAASTTLITVLSHLVFPMFRSRFGWTKSAAIEIIRFGKWMFLTSVVVFAASQVDRIFLARFVPLTEIGLYSIAFMWAQLPATAAQTWFGRMTMPIASEELRSSKPSYRRMKKHRRYIVGAMLVAISILAAIFDPIFHLLYTSGYWQATEFIPVLLAGTAVRVIDESYRVFNLASGKPQYTALGCILSIVLFVTTVPFSFAQLGTVGVGLSYAISQLGTLALSSLGVRRQGLRDFGFDLIALFPLSAVLVVEYTLW